MQADHLIKFSKDHPMMTPKISALRIIGGVLPSTPISQENVLKGVKNLRNWVGQMPKVVKANKSVAAFKLRKGMDLVVLVTIRKKIILYPLIKAIIYTEGVKGSIRNNHIRFGVLPTNSLLEGAGANVDIYLNGVVKENRGEFFKSQLLIP